MKPKQTTKRAPIARDKYSTPELVAQPHGGALRRGNPGQWGGGRPRNATRALMRGNLEQVIPKLHEAWKKGEVDALQYADYLAKYAIGPLNGVSDAELDEFARQVAETVFQECGAEAFERVSARLAAVRQNMAAT